MQQLFEEMTTTRKRRDEDVNRSETLIIGGVVMFMNDDMLYMRRDMNTDCDLHQLMDVMRQVRRSIQIGCKQEQRMAIFPSIGGVIAMYYGLHFERDTVRDVLVKRLHAEIG